MLTNRSPRLEKLRTDAERKEKIFSLIQRVEMDIMVGLLAV